MRSRINTEAYRAHRKKNQAGETVLLLKAGLAKKRLKFTKQREAILEAFLKEDHVTAENLYHRVASTSPPAGLATIYRTLNLFCELGISQQRHFFDNKTMYDNVLHKKHHDHLICYKCGKIIEFECSEIEQLQDKMAKKFGFLLQNHRLELYGICKDPERCPELKAKPVPS